MIRALVYGDLQATDGAERCYTNPTIPLQRYRVDAFYKLLSALYIKYECNALWDLGDTTDDRTAIPLPVLQSLKNGMAPFQREPYNIKLIGNHEQYTRSAEIDCGCLFEDKFTVIRGNKLIAAEGAYILACSYPDSTSAAVNEIKELLNSVAQTPIIVLGHLELSGAKMKSGVSLTGIPTSLFNQASLALLGHIHLPQSLNEVIHYVGSPFQQDFGEAGESKRLGLVTIDNDTIDLSWISVTGFPEYRNVSYDEFMSTFNPDAEDRYRVKITNAQEADKFYTHQYSNRAVVEYAYQVLDQGSKGLETEQTSWDLASAAARWVKEHNPELKGIAASTEDLLQFGIQLTEN